MSTLRFGNRVNANDRYGAPTFICPYFDNTALQVSGTYFVIASTYVDGVDDFPRNLRIRKYRNNVELSSLIKIDDILNWGSDQLRCTHLPDSHVVIVCAGQNAICTALDDDTLEVKYDHLYQMKNGIGYSMSKGLATMNIPFSASIKGIICSRTAWCYIINENMTYLGYDTEPILPNNDMTSLMIFPIYSNPGTFYVTYYNISTIYEVTYGAVCSVYTNSPTMDPTDNPSYNPTNLPTFNPSYDPTKITNNIANS